MILYGSTISPFVRKVAVYAAEKGIELEIQPTGLPNPGPEFLAASPFRKMPAFRDGDYTLADSSAIIHYLEARHPEPSLIPAGAEDRGRAIWFDEFADTLVCACGSKIFFNRVVAPRFLGREGDLGAAERAERDELPPLLDYLETVIPDNGFLVGNSLTLADISVASPFANFRHCDVRIDAEKYPRITDYTAQILSRPSFARLIDREAALLSRRAA